MDQPWHELTASVTWRQIDCYGDVQRREETNERTLSVAFRRVKTYMRVDTRNSQRQLHTVML
jgi:hypothetical protein